MATKYSKAAQEKVHTELHEMKEGTLKSGRSGKKVTDPKQAIAIGLSEARKEGKKVPEKKAATKKSTGTKKAATKKNTTRKTAARKSDTSKAATKTTATKAN